MSLAGKFHLISDHFTDPLIVHIGRPWFPLTAKGCHVVKLPGDGVRL